MLSSEKLYVPIRSVQQYRKTAEVPSDPLLGDAAQKLWGGGPAEISPFCIRSVYVPIRSGVGREKYPPRESNPGPDLHARE